MAQLRSAAADPGLDVANILAEFFADEDDILVAYLFGSRARGDAGAASDFDLAVLVDAGIPPDRRYRWTHELSQLLQGAPVDLIILNDASVELRYGVIAEGIRVYERSRAARVEFEANTLSRYGDLLPMLRDQRREIVEKGPHDRGVQRYREALGKTLRVLKEVRGAARQAD